MVKENEIRSLGQKFDSQAHQVSSLQEELVSANSQLSSLSNSFMVCPTIPERRTNYQIITQRLAADFTIVNRSAKRCIGRR